MPYATNLSGSPVILFTNFFNQATNKAEFYRIRARLR